MAQPLTTLTQGDIVSLSSSGWVIHPPKGESESKEEELFRLIIESNGMQERMKTLLKRKYPKGIPLRRKPFLEVKIELR